MDALIMIDPAIAYFSMEIALDPSIPTYSGGLGILAGDTIRSAADLKVPLCAVSLIYHKGYFRQHLDGEGRQREESSTWKVGQLLKREAARVKVEVEGRVVVVQAWRFEVSGASGFQIPVFLLDTDLPENSGYHRTLTDSLYGGDAYYRICQEVILGLGGVRMLRALGFAGIEKFHLNEGHAAFLTLELLSEEAARNGRDRLAREDVAAVRSRCVFTTHTPVPVGHDQFSREMAERVIGPQRGFFNMPELFCPRLSDLEHIAGDWGEACLHPPGGEFRVNMTYLALNMSHYVNGVAKKHAEISRLMFASYEIDAITNGVHAATWTSPPFQELFDRHMPSWRGDNFSLRYALRIEAGTIWSCHQEAKEILIRKVNETAEAEFEVDAFTLGFARRATQYKRGDLLFHNLDRLRELGKRHGPLQIVFAGKAHPRDADGKAMIERVHRAGAALGDRVRVTYLENYEMDLAQLVTSGVDLWLNTPSPPMEASGTSGMKAALNGVPSLSILDGWWIEGCIEGRTGWAIGGGQEKGAGNDRDRTDALALYDKLAAVLDLFHQDRDSFVDVMRSTIALNGSFFNTQRMIQEYVLKAYFR